jgi:hypothetical protein
LTAKAFKQAQTAENPSNSNILIGNSKKMRLPSHLILIIMAKNNLDLARLNLQLKKSKQKNPDGLWLECKLGPSKH